MRARWVYLSRWVCRDVPSNLLKLAEEAAAAAAAGADLCVFPESFLHGYTRKVAPRTVRERFAGISADHPGTAFLFGSFTEDRRNRMTVWKGGRELARYDKIHLFGPNNEGSLWDPGDAYAAVRLDGLTWGLVNCNDIRFPEQSRALRLRAGCDALVAIGWWPWRRDHVWATLLRARAIENGVFTVGCAVAASDHPGESFSGAGNHVFDPLGDAVRTTDDHLYRLDFSRSSEVLIDPSSAFVDTRRLAVFSAPDVEAETVDLDTPWA